MTGLRTGIYVDSNNINSNGGSKFQYDTLRRHFEASGTVTQKHVYLAYNDKRGEASQAYAQWHVSHLDRIARAGFKAHCSTMKHYQQGDGTTSTKGNVDVEMTVDVMMHHGRLDRVVLVTGDGDFVALVLALQSLGIRVDVLAFSNYSRDLANTCDGFINASLIPNILHASADRYTIGVEVMSVNKMVGDVEVRYLSDHPRSLSADDEAWKRERFKLDSETTDRLGVARGGFLSWNGIAGAGAEFKQPW